MVSHTKQSVRIFIATVVALLMFAANSVLCRLALINTDIDANSFTVLRLSSAALMLGLILVLQHRRQLRQQWDNLQQSGSWLAALMLFVYAACFSQAYVSLDAASGALVLFVIMQITLLLVRFLKGQYLSKLEWLGFIIACAGFIFWLSQQNQGGEVDTAGFNLSGLLLMSCAGFAWAIYTLKGQGSRTPQLDTSANFIRSLAFMLVLLPWFEWPSQPALLLALASGALSSGLGYVVWYYALSGLSLTQASLSQLLVPLITALGGFIWAGESLGLELIAAMFVVLLGILLVSLGRQAQA